MDTLLCPSEIVDGLEVKCVRNFLDFLSFDVAYFMLISYVYSLLIKTLFFNFSPTNHCSEQWLLAVNQNFSIDYGVKGVDVSIINYTNYIF